MSDKHRLRDCLTRATFQQLARDPKLTYLEDVALLTDRELFAIAGVGTYEINEVRAAISRTCADDDTLDEISRWIGGHRTKG